MNFLGAFLGIKIDENRVSTIVYEHFYCPNIKLEKYLVSVWTPEFGS